MDCFNQFGFKVVDFGIKPIFSTATYSTVEAAQSFCLESFDMLVSFRHNLQAYPGDYETVHQLLGHKKLPPPSASMPEPIPKASLDRLDKVISEEENGDEEDEL